MIRIMGKLTRITTATLSLVTWAIGQMRNLKYYYPITFRCFQRGFDTSWELRFLDLCMTMKTMSGTRMLIDIVTYVSTDSLHVLFQLWQHFPHY